MDVARACKIVSAIFGWTRFLIKDKKGWLRDLAWNVDDGEAPGTGEESKGLDSVEN